MSDPAHDNNDKLKELLDNAGKQPDSDFEKEALEGYARLENAGEALKLKQELDKRMYPKVFAKRRRVTVYWAAAAAFLLLVGFSAFFVLGTATTSDEQLAISRPVPEAAPASAPPAVPDPAAGEKPQEKTAPQPVKEDAIRSDNTAVTAARKLQPVKRPVAVKAAPPLTQAASEPEQALAMDAVDAGAPENAAARASEKTAEPLLMQQNNAYSPAAPTFTMAPDKAVALEEVQLEKKSARFKKKESRSNNELKASAAGAAPEACYYTGGDKELKKEITEKLAAANLLQKFEAVLEIRPDGTVANVTFKNAYTLTASQQQQVTVILKALDKFNTASEKKREYTLEFKP